MIVEERKLNPIEDSDMDSLFALPLDIIPLETPALRRARMIKNARLRSVIEMFGDIETGSGQIEIRDLPKLFGWDPEQGVHPDMIMLSKLGALESYDVYSLRILLREAGIPISNQEALKLSEEKSQQLTSYMTKFTYPLIMQIYGDDNLVINSFDDVVKLFRDPDIKKAKQRLQQMADKLGITIQEVPKFLEDYGDIFLSLSYYRNCLDLLAPLLENFISSMYQLRNNYQLRQDPNLLNTLSMMESTMNELSAGITGRFENFDRSTKSMWDDLTAERFHKVKALIEAYHTTIGGVLCGLTVKMNAWIRLFPKQNSGGPIKRAEFIMSEMRQGLDNIKRIEDSAPMLAALG
ncbi:hypothetical protein [Pararhodospirillum photometricum]|uniref:Uncharacterized protein n=1 Tax=Pararhodospirillum photometricum DSM 122 TaxID=1150469 RepID=H6SKD3_PARPM|nr:hypothetical protein [Pararhodospirillum photometricum]CCG08448.1 Putative uncharacterized protein [Pararhodospirillum photometricum DSM 122]